MVKRVYNVKIEKLPSSHLTLLKATPSPSTSLPTLIDLRPKMPPIYDQGHLGSCTANALCALIGYDKPGFCGSRLFVYYNERKLENDIPDDAGATLADGIKTLTVHGVCPESEWPYNPYQFAIKPPAKCYQDALKEKALKVQNVLCNLQSMKNCLASGFPFVVGIAIYESFESIQVASNGVVPMPKPNESCLGGHAVVCVGYDDSKKSWIMRNSWGTSWGLKGYFYLPYAYLTTASLASDAWTITLMQ
jgi:C1A family cysteine protease